MTPSDHIVTEADRGYGQRLRAARESAGLSIAEVAKSLRMLVRVVESLENEDWSQLGEPVFIRGQLRSYARLLGLPIEPAHITSDVGTIGPNPLEPRIYTPLMRRFAEQAAQRMAYGVMTAPIEPTELVPRIHSPPMRRFAEQTARRTAYVVITAAIAAPVWLATRPHPAPEQAQFASLDLPAKAERAAGDDRLRPIALESQPKPVVASIAQIPPRAMPADGLTLRFNEDSWVQVMAPDGGTVEEALLGPGDERRYAPGQVGRIVLGNAGAVEVSHRGVVQDLSPYVQANIARIAVSSDGSLAPVVQ